MDANVKLLLVITSVFPCNGVSLRRQLQHIAETQAEGQGYPQQLVSSRRSFYNYDPLGVSTILGSPSLPSHLPEAEPILPGHTLIKPALGMLKSSVKFPHRELEDGSGVYGNYDNIGIRYDSRNERVLYSGFRRMPTNSIMDPELRSNNKIILYLNDNKEPVTKKITNGRIYLKRIYVLKLPKSLANSGNDFLKRKRAGKSHPTTLRSDFENGTASTDLEKEVANRKNIFIDKQDIEKNNYVWNIKNTFNHIAIDQTAPDYADFFPPTYNQNGRQWWFFNEVDLHRPLQTK